MNCPYCGVAFNMWVKKHPECEKKSNEYSSYVINYIEEKLLSGSFKISELSKKFIEAEKFLTSLEMSGCIQAGAMFAVDKWLEDDVIDNKEFDLECGDGEEGLLRKAEKQLNLKLQEHRELLTLPEAQKYLMMALIIVGENIDYIEKEKEIDFIFSEIDEELSKLENKLIEGSNKNA